MYNPAHFALTDPEALQRVIHQHPLGMLVTHGPEGLDANHLPFEYDPSRGEHGTLIAHVARANPVWQQCAGGADVMVVFRGVEGYISPSWYPSKHEAHRQVPTWNYEVVHAHGRLTVRDDEKFVRGVVARLTRTHEATEPQPWKMGDAPADYLDMMLQAIVGLEIAVTRLEGRPSSARTRNCATGRGRWRLCRRGGGYRWRRRWAKPCPHNLPPWEPTTTPPTPPKPHTPSSPAGRA